MYVNLRFLNISGDIYIFNEVDYNVYKLSDKLCYLDIESEEETSAIVQYMLENEIIEESVVYERIFDCSSYVNICEIYVHNNSEENRNLYGIICKKYHIDNCTMAYREKLTEKIEHTMINFPQNLDVYMKLDYVIKSIFYDCKYNISDDKLANLWIIWNQYKTYIKENLNEYQKSNYLDKLISDIRKRRRRLFPCEWGQNKLYIKEGTLYRCEMCGENTIQIDEVGSILSVDEHDRCKLCYARYICGGLCSRKKEGIESLCELICEIVDYLLELYIKKNSDIVIDI